MTLKVERKRNYHPTDWQKCKRLMMSSVGTDAKKRVSHTAFEGARTGEAVFQRAFGGIDPSVKTACPGNGQTQLQEFTLDISAGMRTNTGVQGRSRGGISVNAKENQKRSKSA